MGMKIREKAMKAWAQTRKVKIELEGGKVEHGYTQRFAPDILLHGVAESSIDYDHITGIRFVDEGEEGDSITKKLEHAIIHGYSVKVTYQEDIITKQCVGEIDIFDLSVDAIGSYVCFKGGTGLTVCLEAIKDVEIVYDKPSTQEPARWEFETMQNGDRCIVILPTQDRKHGIILAKLTNDVTDAQGEVMAASLQMRDALRMVRERGEKHEKRVGAKANGGMASVFNATQWRKITEALDNAGG